jgi:pilus assembly protein TadC
VAAQVLELRLRLRRRRRRFLRRLPEFVSLLAEASRAAALIPLNER